MTISGPKAFNTKAKALLHPRSAEQFYKPRYLQHPHANKQK